MTGDLLLMQPWMMACSCSMLLKLYAGMAYLPAIALLEHLACVHEAELLVADHSFSFRKRSGLISVDGHTLSRARSVQGDGKQKTVGLAR